MLDHTPWVLIAKYLSGECSKQERLQLETWLEDPEHYEAFKKIEAAWREQLPLQQHGKYEVERGVQLLKHKMGKKATATTVEAVGNQHSKVYYWAIAACVTILLLTAIFWVGAYINYHPAQVSYVEKTSNKNQIIRLALPDGSQVWLNEKSSIRYPKKFGVKQREVFLTGEAFFEVVPNKSKPFIVISQGLSTRVLGTSFNVKAYPADALTIVSVATGKVAVSKGVESEWKELAQLTPQQQLTVDKKNNKSYRQMIRLSQIASWRERQLVFRNNTYEEVIQALEKRYNVMIHLESDTLRKCRIMASFEPQMSLSEVLRLLSMSNSFHFVINNDQVKILGGECH